MSDNIKACSITTDSNKQLAFSGIDVSGPSPHLNLTVDEIIYATKRAPLGKYCMDYSVPSTYLQRNKREEVKTAPDKKNLAPDGPAFSVGKSKRGDYMKAPSFGKDGKEPPHSYLSLRQWCSKKDTKGMDKSKENRKTYIDYVVEYQKKHKYPGPDYYFKNQDKKKDKDKKLVDGKKLVRPSFLDEYQYMAMNNPAPGAYNIQPVVKSTKEKVRSKSAITKYVPGSWKPKRDQGHGPGDYEIVRIMTVANDKDKAKRKLVSNPLFERAKYGIISKPHVTKRLSEKPEVKADIGAYFKDLKDLDTSFTRIVKPMRKY